MIKLFLIFTVIAAASIVRIISIQINSFPFPQDMGRDLLWARDIYYYLDPTLIGPAASIWGIYFGPLWFYYLAVWLKIFNGLPLASVIAVYFSVILCCFLVFLLTKKVSKKLALFSLIFVSFNSLLISLSTFAFHANILPILTLFFIMSMYYSFISNIYYLVPAAFAVSLMYHADPAPAFVFTIIYIILVFAFRLYKIKKYLTSQIYSLLIFSLPFVPQIIFEIRNNFLQTKALLSFLKGDNPSLSGQLSFGERIVNRFVIVGEYVKNHLAGENIIFAVILFLVLILISKKLLLKNQYTNFSIFIRINALTIFLFFIIFSFINVELKGWYIYGLIIPFSFLFGSSYKVMKKPVFFAFLAVFLFLNLKSVFKPEKQIKNFKDPASYRNVEGAVDYIYMTSQDEKYSVYIYTPPIYDYPYQYLFWWKGIVQEKGFPSEVAYLPNKPEYIKNKSNYNLQKTKEDVIYLIIENNTTENFYSKQNWINSFNDYRIVSSVSINEAISVEKRIKKSVNSNSRI